MSARRKKRPPRSKAPPSKRSKTAPTWRNPNPPKPCKLDLSDVPKDIPPILADDPESTSKFKGVYWTGTKYKALILVTHIGKDGGGKTRFSLGNYDTEEEAGVMYARARHKYPESRARRGKLDLSDTPKNLPPVPSEVPGISRFKGVYRSANKAKKWEARIWITSLGGIIQLGSFKTEEEAGSMYARARYKYPLQASKQKPCDLDLSDVPEDIPPIPSNNPRAASQYKGVCRSHTRWHSKILVPGRGYVQLGSYQSEEDAGRIFARARYKYPAPAYGPLPKECPLDLSSVPKNLSPIPSTNLRSSSRYLGVVRSKYQKEKWKAHISIKGVHVYLGSCDTEEEAGIMVARARYKYPKEIPRNLSKRARASKEEDGEEEGSDTACMVCGLNSNSDEILLCDGDGCDNEAHITCVGLSAVPPGKWFCSSCRPSPRHQRKAPRSAKAAKIRKKPLQCESVELDEVDGFTIEASSGPPEDQNEH